MFAALLLAPLMIFHGNVALLEDVYRSFLDLPASTKATPANARSVATRLTSFLHRAGYALATVRARIDGDQIVVDVDDDLISVDARTDRGQRVTRPVQEAGESRRHRPRVCRRRLRAGREVQR